LNPEHSITKGTIIKGIGGFYYVEASGRVYECKAKGLFRKKGITPMIGDNVIIRPGENGNESIIKAIVLPRINSFIRPPVANIELSMIVSASAEPDPVFSFLDRLIIMSEKNETELILVFNKCDLITEEQREVIRNVYKGTGYEIYFVSTVTGEGVELLKSRISGVKTMLSGASGVGKSSLANMLGGFEMETGDVSRKTGRGKHTTRHVELLVGKDDIRIFDTPGFTSFEVPDMKAEELRYCYPEFEGHEDRCRFSGCTHRSEPDCGVKEALNNKEISEERYDSYVRLYNELKERNSSY